MSRVLAWLHLNLYMPVFHFRLWRAHRQAVQALLEDIGWIDLNL